MTINTFNSGLCYICSVSHYKIQILKCPTVLLIPQLSHLLRLRLTTSTLQRLPLYLETAHLRQPFLFIQPKTVTNLWFFFFRRSGQSIIYSYLRPLISNSYPHQGQCIRGNGTRKEKVIKITLDYSIL